MKIKHPLFWLTLLFFFFQLNTSSAQNRLKVTNLNNPKRSFEIKEKNRVTVRYIDTTRNRGYTPLLYLGKKLHYANVRVVGINDSLITIRRAFKKPLAIKINGIAQIRKDQLGYAFLYGIGLSAVMIPALVYLPVDYRIIAGGFLITGLLVGEKVVYPLKNVHTEYYKSKNQWKLEVVP